MQLAGLRHSRTLAAMLDRANERAEVAEAALRATEAVEALQRRDPDAGSPLCQHD